MNQRYIFGKKSTQLYVSVDEYICWSTMFYVCMCVCLLHRPLSEITCILLYIETVFLHFAKEEEYKENIEGLRLKRNLKKIA